MERLEGRHAAVVDLARYFEYEHLPNRLRAVSKAVHDLAQDMIDHLPDCPMLTRGLGSLLSAKDSFVRAALDAPAADGD
ncbi:Hypothetical protein AJAP_42420 (plasmid) [Amycolatopsis japonica]|uniref:Uncharacterized protein n=1 Tax=Amycolatopsis japonica TaxID=208439 RepID=A0A075VEB2_9PSEU|nr:hypothetical protein [Amycolatopsis japonica]AIG81255.1 Hypothetical protein AJAP_42420 [Amycolatopsis japonica]